MVYKEKGIKEGKDEESMDLSWPFPKHEKPSLPE